MTFMEGGTAADARAKWRQVRLVQLARLRRTMMMLTPTQEFLPTLKANWCLYVICL
jgi:hypothetical protein